ncbi:peroxiredoxin-like family protein [Roseateles depolymerans]|uniref:thioredoxin-dependent peroxiredoxin n=1 Tax=Roseateles depolymerans TaxID=76731 RepID=A0A0U3LI53_9BURK|nr:peroxiredoxin-like family protein [Roseateles depolymerans]ALV04519.1 Putative antioxidant, AhpC/TSA family [Roseateles depolymerans]REG14052.1 peroxiredoxin [Roseateles depolymerans]
MEKHKTLADQLADYKAGFKQRVAPERVAMMEAATADLRSSGIEARAMQVGARAPDVTLPDAMNRPVRLSDLWRRGSLVLIFYRGGWCPYCNLELRAWNEHLPSLKQMGGQLVAVSPQTPDHSLSTAQKNDLAYPVLSDSALQASEGFGLTFELPPQLIDLYSRVGNDLPVLNGNGRWELPVPATYVIDRDGRVVFAHIEADYRERAEPKMVLEAVAHARDADLI